MAPTIFDLYLLSLGFFLGLQLRPFNPEFIEIGGAHFYASRKAWTSMQLMDLELLHLCHILS